MSSGKEKEKATQEYTPAGLSLIASAAGAGRAQPQVDAYLGQGCKAVGTLSFTGPVEINCYIEGELVGEKKLVIGEAAIVKARVTGAEIVVKGSVEGDIIASERLVLKPPAKVRGNISSPLVVIEEGVLFEGGCEMKKAQTNGAYAGDTPVAVGQ